MRKGCLRVAVVGIGGFAGAHHTALLGLEATGLLKVIAACDPEVDRLEERRHRYRFDERCVALYKDFDTLLAERGSQLDWVTVVSPIRFHAIHHRACVTRGIACYLEKPPTLDPDELRQMLDVEAKAQESTQVGFNYISQPWRQELKMRLLRGDFGHLRKVAFKGLWRRSREYYERNSWVGRLFLGDYLLTDSCCGNAMSHFLHNLLFHAGRDEIMSWAPPSQVQAELYRANPIEGTDTVFARGTLNGDVSFLLAASHACEATLNHLEVLECENARIEIPEAGSAKILYQNGTVETFEPTAANLKENLKSYCDYLHGMRSRPFTTLEDCKPVVHLNALLYLAAGQIHTIFPPDASSRHFADDSRETIYIPGIESVSDRFLQTERFPSEMGIPWARAAGSSNLGDLAQLRPVLERMKAARPGTTPPLVEFKG